MQTCRSSLILLCDNSNYGMSTRVYSKLAWYETANNRHVCVEHRTTLVESKDKLYYVILCVYGVFVRLSDKLRICNKF